MNSDSAILICTKDRPTYLAKTLETILNSELKNIRQILIADGSIKAETRILCDQLSHENHLIPISWMKVAGGKPVALNEGFAQLASYAIVHCLDDDITVPRNYFQSLEEFFAHNNQIVGCSPLIRNRSEISIFLQNHKHAGKITKHGNNYWFKTSWNNVPFEHSEWLPGGACSYRTSVLDLVTVSTTLHDKEKSYALGDDVDLSLQVSKHGTLACLTFLEVLHEEGPSLKNSESNFYLDTARAKWKVFLCRKYPDKFSLIQIAIWELFSGIFHIVKRDKLMNLPRLFTFFKTLGIEIWRTKRFEFMN
jgi:GT2 family glycosyltransferase